MQLSVNHQFHEPALHKSDADIDPDVVLGDHSLCHGLHPYELSRNMQIRHAVVSRIEGHRETCTDTELHGSLVSAYIIIGLRESGTRLITCAFEQITVGLVRSVHVTE